MGEEDGALIRERLSRLLRWLDAQLCSPVEVDGDSRRYTVWVFKAIGYKVDRVRRTVGPVRYSDGKVMRGTYTVDLRRPLFTPDWIPFVLRAQGLTDYGRQRHLFRRDISIAHEEAWIAEAAYRRLLGDARFRRLRSALLPSALALEPELLKIVHACRDSRTFPRIDSECYTTVWRHELQFRSAFLESPKLLPLAFAALKQGSITPRGDLIHQVYKALRGLGLPRAGWQYLARHGTEFLGPVWRSRIGSRISATAVLLREFSLAGLPLPSSRAVLKIVASHWWRWMELLASPDGRGPGVLSPIATAYLREAHRVADTPEEPFWREEVPIVLDWAREVRPMLDKLQRRAGWPWMVRQARAWDRRQTLLRHGGPRSWNSAIEAFEGDGYCATVIGDLEGLVDEGAAFHNCLGTLAGACQSGCQRFFVIRCVSTGTRLAVACVAWIAHRRAWALGNLKGLANADVPGPLYAFGRRLAAEYSRRAADLTPPSANPVEEFFYGIEAEATEPGSQTCLSLEAG